MFKVEGYIIFDQTKFSFISAPDLVSVLPVPAPDDGHDRIHLDDRGHRARALRGRAPSNQLQPGHERRQRSQVEDHEVPGPSHRHQRPLQRDQVLRDHLRLRPHQKGQLQRRPDHGGFLQRLRQPDLPSVRRVQQHRGLRPVPVPRGDRVPSDPQHHGVPDGPELLDLLQLDPVRHPRRHPLHPPHLLQRTDLLGHPEEA